MTTSSEKQGIVYLVGAGPGDPGLITVRGAECLRRADVVVYDNLASPLLLDLAPVAAERIYAGKKAEHHYKTQDEINALLVDRARAGHTVVRLKGGDPFVFGRGGEEAEFLEDYSIPWEVVPGITSAIAAAAYAGIPVTHRHINGSVHIVTGHESDSDSGAQIDWAQLAAAGGTIVVLMGVKNLPRISAELTTHGLAPDTPVALVRWGTTPRQQTLITTLANAATDATAAGIKPPAVCIIGEVVRLREKIAWVERRPLFGLRIAVTRPQDENARLSTLLRDAGAEVVQTPTLEKIPSTDLLLAKEMTTRLDTGEFDWIAITSGHGAREFAARLQEAGRDMRALARSRVAAIGQRTAQALRSLGIAPDLLVEDSTQEGLAAALIAQGASNVLVPRATQARDELESRLTSAGIPITVWPVYSMIPHAAGIAALLQHLDQGSIDLVTFTSARTFEALAEAAGETLQSRLRTVKIAVIGPITRAAIQGAGFDVAMESTRPDMESLAASILQWRLETNVSAPTT